MRDIKPRTRLSKIYHCCLCLIFDQTTMAQEQKYLIYTYLVIFSLFRSLSIRKSAYVLQYKMSVCSVQMISRLDSKSNFKMFTLFSGRQVGVPPCDTNMAAPYWAL